MSRISWDTVGERYFEVGVDRGVIYKYGQGQPWSGLISVDETPNGGEPKPFYFDGLKYLNLASSEEYEATISAFGFPDFMYESIGLASMGNGLIVTNQKRQPFDLCYRTKLGNDSDGVDHGYKLHLIYNALAKPSQTTRQTLSQELSPMTYSWGVTTTPPRMTGYRNTAHLIVDSRYAYNISALEDILYGSVDADPSLPDPDTVSLILSGD